MKFSDELQTLNEDQISDLWGVFIAKCEKVIECWKFLLSIQLTHEYPDELQTVDLPSLVRFIMKVREFDLAKADYENKRAEANARFAGACLDATRSNLVVGAWIKVGDYGIMFHYVSPYATPKPPTIDTWSNVLLCMEGDK